MGRERESESRPSGSDRSSGVSTRDASSVGKKKKKKKKKEKKRANWGARITILAVRVRMINSSWSVALLNGMWIVRGPTRVRGGERWTGADGRVGNRNAEPPNKMKIILARPVGRRKERA